MKRKSHRASSAQKRLTRESSKNGLFVPSDLVVGLSLSLSSRGLALGHSAGLGVLVDGGRWQLGLVPSLPVTQHTLFPPNSSSCIRPSFFPHLCNSLARLSASSYRTRCVFIVVCFIKTDF